MENPYKYNMLVSDFDGTMADSGSKVSNETIDELKRIGVKDIIRVVATGRSLYSLMSVVGKDFPIDYAICSSGIAVYDWKNKELLDKSEIDSIHTKKIYEYLVDKKYDFMVQLPVPNNHFFHHFCSGIQINEDFGQRIKNYEINGLKLIKEQPETASQFVVICPEEKDHYRTISREFDDLNVIKATSPLDGRSIWIEILPYGISKASGIEFLSRRLNIDVKNIVSVGNDYYDLDMLNFTNREKSYVVENSPEELKAIFNVIGSNDNNGVARLIRQLY